MSTWEPWNWGMISGPCCVRNDAGQILTDGWHQSRQHQSRRCDAFVSEELGGGDVENPDQIRVLLFRRKEIDLDLREHCEDAGHESR